MNDEILRQIQKRDAEEEQEEQEEREEEQEEEQVPEVTCSKCGSVVTPVPENIKFVKRTKQIQIKCPKCNEYTMIPRDEHYDEMIQYLLDTGRITEEDLVSRKRRKEETEKEFEEFEEEFEGLEEEFDEYTILKEILDEEKKISKTTKRHILEWMRLKPLEPHEVYTLLTGFGVNETAAKRVSTAYAYALEKEKLKRERYSKAVDNVFGKYKSVSIPSSGTGITGPMTIRGGKDYYSYYGTARRPTLEDYYVDKIRSQPIYTSESRYLELFIQYLLDEIKQLKGTEKSPEIQELREQINRLREELMKKELEKELAERDKELDNLKAQIATLYRELSQSSKPESVQELEIKKEKIGRAHV